MLFYVRRDRTDYYSIGDGEPRTATSVDFHIAPEFCASLKQIWHLTSTETIWLIRDGDWKGGGGMEVGGEVDYTYRYIVTTRMTPALRWAAMRAILMLH